MLWVDLINYSHTVILKLPGVMKVVCKHSLYPWQKESTQYTIILLEYQKCPFKKWCHWWTPENKFMNRKKHNVIIMFYFVYCWAKSICFNILSWPSISDMIVSFLIIYIFWICFWWVYFSVLNIRQDLTNLTIWWRSYFKVFYISSLVHIFISY